MHAKASIPAWAKLLALSAGVVAIMALIVAAPWRGAQNTACVELLQNVELVQSGQASRRISHTTTFRQGLRGTPRIGLREGDFAGAISLDGIRECLGSDWTETHASAQYQSYGDAWVFARSGQPLVLYVQSRSDQYRRVEMKIIIERAE
jgi:hypothetical protein